MSGSFVGCVRCFISMDINRSLLINLYTDSPSEIYVLFCLRSSSDWWVSNVTSI